LLRDGRARQPRERTSEHLFKSGDTQPDAVAFSVRGSRQSPSCGCATP
jgi:hypothetical protein